MRPDTEMDRLTNLAYAESPMSLLLRCVEVKAGLHRLLSEAGCDNVSIKAIHNNGGLLQALSLQTGLSLNDLRDSVYSIVGPGQLRRFVGKIALPYWMFDLDHPKVCPACLRESRSTRKLWDLSSTCVCTRHRTLLVSVCKGCGRRLGWFRHFVAACKCGRPLYRAVAEQSEPEAVLASKWLEAWTESAGTISLSKTNFGLEEAAYLLHSAAKLSMPSGDVRLSFLTRPDNPKKLHDEYVAAVRVLRSLPHSLWQSAGARSGFCSADVRVPLKSSWLTEALKEGSRTKGASGTVRALWRCLFACKPYDTGRTKAFGHRGIEDLRRRKISLVAAYTTARILQISIHSVGRLPTDFGLNVAAVSPRGHPRWSVDDLEMAIRKRPSRTRRATYIGSAIMRPLVQTTGFSVQHLRNWLSKGDLLDLRQYQCRHSVQSLRLMIGLFCDRLTRTIQLTPLADAGAQTSDLRTILRKIHSLEDEVAFLRLVTFGLIQPVGRRQGHQAIDLLFDLDWINVDRRVVKQAISEISKSLGRNLPFSLKEVVEAAKAPLPPAIVLLSDMLEASTVRSFVVKPQIAGT